MAFLMQTSPASFTSLLERLVYDPLFRHALRTDKKARKAAQRLWLYYCHGNVSFASPSARQWSSWEDSVLEYAKCYQEAAWATRFEVLVQLTSSELFPVELLPRVHETLMKSSGVRY
jgi:hypothetical protein